MNKPAPKTACCLAYSSPIGVLEICTQNQAIVSLAMRHAENSPFSATAENELLQACKQQLDEYFSGKRTRFELPLKPQGTAFQQKVWNELLNIPYGKTATYGQIAQAIGKPKAARAVGMANNRNPVSILIPCHRVIGANGKMVGYGGGLWRKEWLLKHEKNNP